MSCRTDSLPRSNHHLTANSAPFDKNKTAPIDNRSNEDEVLRFNQRFERHNEELRRELMETKAELKKAQEQSRLDFTKLLELQHVLVNSGEGMELLVDKSLRLAELSLLVDDMKLKLKQAHSENHVLKSQIKTHGEKGQSPSLQRSPLSRSVTSASDGSDDPSVPTTVTAMTTFDSDGNGGSFDNDISGDDTDESDSRTITESAKWTKEKKLLLKKCKSLEQSLDAVKQQSKRRQVKTTMHLQSMQGQIAKLEAEKRQLSLKNRSLLLNKATTHRSHNDRSSNNESLLRHREDSPNKKLSSALRDLNCLPDSPSGKMRSVPRMLWARKGLE